MSFQVETLFSASAFAQRRGPALVAPLRFLRSPSVPRNLFLSVPAEAPRADGSAAPRAARHKTFNLPAPVLSDGPRTHAQMSESGYRLC